MIVSNISQMKMPESNQNSCIRITPPLQISPNFLVGLHYNLLTPQYGKRVIEAEL
jgi:hypothetical protein